MKARVGWGLDGLSSMIAMKLKGAFLESKLGIQDVGCPFFLINSYVEWTEVGTTRVMLGPSIVS